MSLPFPSNTTVIDNFNRSNEALADSSDWQAWGGTGQDLVSNAVEPSTTAGSSFDIYVTSTYNYCECYVKILKWPDAPDAGDVTLLWVGGRVSVLGNAYLAELQHDPDGDFSIEILRVDSGVPTYLGATVWLTEITDPTGYMLGIRLEGDTIEGYIHDTVSWEKVISRTDSTYSSANYMALGSFAESGPTSDLRIDNFSGGTIIPNFPTNHTVLDNFNRSNEGPPPSQYWTDLTNGLKVVSNRAEGTTNDAYNGSHWFTVFNADSEIYAEATEWPGTPGTDEYNLIQLVTRLDAVQIDGYTLSAEEDQNEDFYLYIYRLDNGVETTLGEAVYLGNALNPVGYWIGIQSDGNIHRGFVNSGGGWTHKMSRSDSTYTNNGYFVLGMLSSASVGDISVDNFSGGNIRLPRRVFNVT